MARQSEIARQVAYPQLSREQINLIIDALLWAVRDRDLGGRMDEAELAIGKLADFYTRRWGLPPAITGRTDRIRKLAGGDLSS